jgi:glycolate oxidase subunit GlcD
MGLDHDRPPAGGIVRNYTSRRLTELEGNGRYLCRCVSGDDSMDFMQEIKEIVGESNCREELVERLCYSRDMSVHEGVPEAVVFAKTTEQVSRILRLADRGRVPVTTRGSGTSVTGAVLPCRNKGIVLDLSRMNSILEINRKDGYARVEPGVICNALNQALAPTHFFPPDPASAPLASIGGMVSTNASGNRALKYGTTKDYIMGLEVVLADGRVLRTGSKARKTSAGYDLVHLFSQAEGTLGVITEVTVKILPMPPYIAFAQASFPDVESAGRGAEAVLSSGIPLSSLEILDRTSIDVVRKTMGLEIPEEVGCILFVEIDGHKEAVEKQVRQIDEMFRAHGGLDTVWSDDPNKRMAMWQARQGLVSALSKVKRGSRLIPLVEDFGVPISQIPATIKAIQDIGRKHEFPMCIFGHVGDGNLHAVIIMDPRDREEWEKVKLIAQDFILLTREFQGTFTAEHGVGMAKSPYIGQELGVGKEVMEAIKHALDPNNILNPGKMGFSGSIADILEEFAFEPLLAHPERVRGYGKKVDDEIMACIMCGFCRNGCPTYAERLLESVNARGRVLLAYNLMTGRLRPSEEVASRFYSCTTCQNCRFACPAAIEVGEIVEAARRRMVEAGYLPEVFKPLLASMRQRGNPFGEEQAKRTEVYPSSYKEPQGPLDVLLYLGCVPSYQDMRIIPSVMKVMDRAGVRYGSLGVKEQCCGYLAYLVGSMEEFHNCMETNLSSFSKLGPGLLVTTCAGCYKTFKELYPRHMPQGGHPMPEVLHVVEYVDRLLAEGKLEFRGTFPAKVIYHDPCDLGRHMGVYEPPRRVLQAVPGVELLEFPLNRQLAKCCGGGGGLKAFDNPMSDEIAYKRVRQAARVGAEVIVSACPSCKRSLQAAAARLKREEKFKIQVMDITEVLAKAL